MKFKTAASLSIGAAITSVLFGITLLAGYISNIVWLFRHADSITMEGIIALVGVVMAPLGAFHGIYTWF